MLDSQHPLWTAAFRPLYLLAAVFGALVVVAWGFGLGGNTILPGLFWHAHEMIWGYSGAVVVGFLLTAVSAWTNQPSTQGAILMHLVMLWIIARLAAMFPASVPISGTAGTLFYVMAGLAFLRCVGVARNRRNYAAGVGLLVFALGHALFHWHLITGNLGLLRSMLWGGLVMVAAFIGLIGIRIIPFFIATQLNLKPFEARKSVMILAVVLPIAMTTNLIFMPKNLLAFALCGIAGGAINLTQCARFYHAKIWREPMLWILFIGFVATQLGLVALGLSVFFPGCVNLGIHLIAVGGIGTLTLGVMARSAANNTGRPVEAVFPLTHAFCLMISSAVVRTIAIFMPGHDVELVRVSSILFAAALVLYLLRYTPWLISPKINNEVD